MSQDCKYPTKGQIMDILTRVINAFKKSFVVDNPFENELKRTLS